MRLAVNPTRMELLKLRRRSQVAQRGHKLLKDKQDELVRRFLEMTTEITKRRKNLIGTLISLNTGLKLTRAIIENTEFQRTLQFTRGTLDLQITYVPLMNLRIPQPKVTITPPTVNIPDSPPELTLIYRQVNSIILELVNLAGLEKTVSLLAAEIERTRRRVNALEYIFIPNLVETIKYITFKLEETARNDLTRLMKIKELIRSH